MDDNVPSVYNNSNSNNNNVYYDDDSIASVVHPIPRIPSPFQDSQNIPDEESAAAAAAAAGEHEEENDENVIPPQVLPSAEPSSLSAHDVPVPDNRPSDNVKACKNIHVIFTHDLSGSMNASRKMIADGTNEFIQDLQNRYAKPCQFNARFCLITFSGDKITVGEWTDIHSMAMFCADSFVCNGTTPLWDACAIGLDKMTSECNDGVAAMYVFTDGEDNNSTKATRQGVHDRIAKLDLNVHTMLFIGSDPLSSAANAAAIGVSRTKSLNPSSDNTPSAMRACTNAIARCVTGETQTPEFNADDIIMSEGPSEQSYDMVDDVHVGIATIQTPCAIKRRRSGVQSA